MIEIFWLVLPGCGDRCRDRQPWVDVQVWAEDPDDETQTQAVEHAEGALGWFSRWSGADEVCVSGVEVAADVGDAETYGGYQWPTGDIRLEVGDAGVSTFTLTLHELCHAIDVDYNISLDRPELFETTSEAMRSAFRLDRRRAREVFADRCMRGPQDLTRRRIWRAECGYASMDDGLETDELVVRSVYPHAETLPWSAPSMDVQVGGRWGLRDPGEGWTPLRVAPAGERLAALYAQDQEGEARVTLYDPRTGDVEQDEVVPVRCPEGSSSCALDLIPGDDGAWLSWVRDGVPTLRRVTIRGSEELPHPCPEVGGALVLDGVIWGEPDWSTSPWSMVGCDLRTGEPAEAPPLDLALPLETPSGDPPTPELERYGEHLAVWVPDVGLAWLDEDTAEWHEQALPPHLDIADVAPTPHGDWLIAIEALDPLGIPVRTFVVLNPGSGAFSTPLDPCPVSLLGIVNVPVAVLAGEGWSVLVKGESLSDATTELFPVDVHPWPEDDGGPRWGLTRMETEVGTEVGSEVDN